ncbi:MAG: acyltransferase [Candidatus Paceibacterota bacterium]
MNIKNSIFIPQLNSLRFFAAIAVVIFHFGKWSYPFNNGILNDYASAMNLAVSFFFVLSGFIMITVYEHLKIFSWKNTIKFYLKRIIRIVPLYIIALLLVSLGYLFSSNIELSIINFVESLFFLQAWIPTDALILNFTGWSLSVEMFFYLLFPFIVPFFLSKKNVFKATVIFWIINSLLFIFLYLWLGQSNVAVNNFIKYFPLLHLNQFLIGMLAGKIYLKGIKGGNLIFLLALLFLIIYLPYISNNSLITINHNGILAPVFALVIIGAASSTSIIKKLLSLPLFVKGGDASYGIYILQFPIYLAIYELYKICNIYDYLGEEGRFYIYLVFLVLISFLSFKTLEKLFKHLAHQ